jgi:hypothetical protein
MARLVIMFKGANQITAANAGCRSLFRFAVDIHRPGVAELLSDSMLSGSSMLTRLPVEAGGLDAYEFYVWFQLYFLCSDCGASLDCPVGEDDTEAPDGEWTRRNARRARSSGWYVHPLSSEGGLIPTCFCPACAQSRSLRIPQ